MKQNLKSHSKHITKPSLYFRIHTHNVITASVMMRGSKSPRLEETRILLTSNGSDDEDSDTSCDYDTAISRTGYGKFHYLLMLVCGWANASDAVEILCISFLLPSAECDLELTPARKGWLSAILFVGMMIGGYVWGSLGDTLGRRTVLINAMVVNTVAGLLSSLSQDFYLLMLLRFLSGVGVGGSIPVVWTYYAGQPLLSRGPQLLTLSLQSSSRAPDGEQLSVSSPASG